MSEIETEISGATSLRLLAKAVGKSPSAVTKWVRRDDWPFETVPPWSAEDIEQIIAWAAETLKPDMSSDETLRNNRDGFWDRYTTHKRIDCKEHPIPKVGKRDRRAEALKEPGEVCSEFERAVIAGKAELTADQVRDYLAIAVALRALLVRDIDNLGAWLAGHPEKEIDRRLRGVLYDRLSWFNLSLRVNGINK